MYIKTNWVDNTTPIDSTNLNKIEQGIYDNSLVADAVNNVVKPNDETYKDVEITEGQITDVLAVNDVLIKGDTLQDGEPTPDSPVDVNVVSGNNIVYTSNKNLLDISNLNTQTRNGVTITKNKDNSITLNGTSTSTITIDVLINEITLKENTTYVFSKSTNIAGAFYAISLRDKNTVYIDAASSLDSAGKSLNINLSTKKIAKYFRLYIANGKTFTNHTFYPMLEQGSTATTYEPHQGKELPLDLGKNLANIDDIQLQKNWQNEADTTRASIVNIKVKPSTTYTLSSSYTSSSITNVRCVLFGAIGDTLHNGVVSGTFTTTSTTHYLSIEVLANTTFTQSMLNGLKIQLEKGDTATTYVPYNPNPIELCKIGDYQDYFYKSGSKWYLHKEIGKYTLDGINNTFNAKTSATANNVFRTNQINDILPKNNINAICSNFEFKLIADINSTDIIGFGTRSDKIINFGFGLSSSINTLELATQFLQNNNILIYYPLETATNTEITNSTLISQLEAIYNAPLYEQTNITQTNNDLPIVLDITACKDNINGIKAWIRK